MLKGTLEAENQVTAHLQNLTDRWMMKEQEKEVTPTEKIQIIEPDNENYTLRRVTVAAIPSNYGRITHTGQTILVE